MTEEFVCYECHLPIPDGDEVWIDPQTKKAEGNTEPYHVECAPEEIDD
jgi:hypothetical protein